MDWSYQMWRLLMPDRSSTYQYPPIDHLGTRGTYFPGTTKCNLHNTFTLYTLIFFFFFSRKWLLISTMVISVSSTTQREKWINYSATNVPSLDVIMIVADALAPNRRQAISDHHVELTVSTILSLYKKFERNMCLLPCRHLFPQFHVKSRDMSDGGRFYMRRPRPGAII